MEKSAEGKYIVATYEDTLEVVALKLSHNDYEFAEVEVNIPKPVMNINYPIDSFAEKAILTKQAYMHFE